jgi:hypothetical protein
MYIVQLLIKSYRMTSFTYRLAISLLLACLATGSASAQNIITITGNGTAGFSGDSGPATAAQMNAPTGVASDMFGNIYIADYGNSAIRKVDKAGIITTFAGSSTGVAGYSGDGGPATLAKLNYPTCVSFDASGNLYISDVSNHVVRKVDLSGIISTVAGNGSASFSGDGGPATAAGIIYPDLVAFDAAGNMYIPDYNDHRIRKVSTSGVITTIAGNGSAGYSGDGGPALSALLNQPMGLSFNAAGELFFADSHNDRVRKIDITGTITTVAGTGLHTSGPDGSPATASSIGFPTSTIHDASGNLYIAELDFNRIRKVDAAGIITTFAGNGFSAFSGDRGHATACSFNHPIAMTIDVAGNFHIDDYYNNRIRTIPAAPVATFSLSSTSICQDSCLQLANMDAFMLDSFRWSANGVLIPSTGSMPTTLCFASAGPQPVSLYMYNVNGADTFNLPFTVNPTLHPFITESGGVFSASGTYSTYQWYKDGVAISGATTATYTSVEPGTYQVEVSAGGCTAKSNTITTVASTEGLSNARELPISLTPNPNSGSFTLSGYTNSAEKVSIDVTNSIGQVVYNSQVAVSNGAIRSNISLSERLPSGIYLISIRAADAKEVIRFRVER